MQIDRIRLTNYRNYESLDLRLSKDVNIIIGENANGKTNILEAIYIAATSKSHRLAKDSEIIKMNEDFSIISIDYQKENLSRNTTVKLNKKGKKELAIDGEKKKKLSSLLGNIFVVFFSPDDLALVKSSPQVRRRFLDIEISQIDRNYLKNLSSYQKVLKERNSLLKNKNINKDLIKVYDEYLVKYGKEIINRREEFIDDIRKEYKKYHFEISGKSEEADIVYKKNVEEKDFLLKLEERFYLDKERKSTSVGPHRDDFEFISNDINLRNFGSRGQVRTAVLSLKLAEIEEIKKKVGLYPVLLLDDVLSELDEKRQYFLIEQLADIQTILTGTGVEDFILKKLGSKNIYKVENNSIRQI